MNLLSLFYSIYLVCSFSTFYFAFLFCHNALTAATKKLLWVKTNSVTSLAASEALLAFFSVM